MKASSAGVQKGVILLAVCLADAAHVCNIMVPHEIDIAALRRFDNVGLVRNTSSSGGLETRVGWGNER